MNPRIVARAFFAGALMIPAICRPLEAQESIPALSPADALAEESLLAALDAIVDVEFKETELGAGLAEIGRQIHAPIYIEYKKLEEAAVSPDQPLTFSSHQLSARSVLSLILRPSELNWVIKDRVLLITTKEEADQTMVTRIYPVKDLVGEGGDYNSLIDVITTTIAPTSWDEVGGPGSIAELRSAGALVLSQTREIHEELALLLAALRAARGLQGISGGELRAAMVEQTRRGFMRRHRQAGVISDASEPAEAPRYFFSASESWQQPRTHE